MMSVRCLRSVASLTTARSLRSRISTRLGMSRRCSKSRATRRRAGRRCFRRTARGCLQARLGRPTLCGVVRGGGTVLAFEPGEIGAGRTDLLVQSAALGIGDGAGRILRLDLVIDEGIEQELFSHVLDEVFL